MLLNSPPWTADNAIIPEETFAKKSYRRAVEIRPVIEYSRESNRDVTFSRNFAVSSAEKCSVIYCDTFEAQESLKSFAHVKI